jgi:glycosyltransferase involved in cell wall biosynthesis
MNKGKEIYIIDFIGAYCGMDHYDEAFAHLLQNNGFRVKVLSDFDSVYGNHYFPKIFGRSKILSLLILVFAIIKLRLKMAVNRQAYFIYLSYGEYYDMLFLKCAWPNKRLIVDVHEVHALKYSDDSWYSKLFENLYINNVSTVIYHSDRTKNVLEGNSYKGRMIYVPHFKYEFETNYDLNNVGSDIRSTFGTDKIKFLFFGNIRKVKGIDVVEEVFSNLFAERVPFELVVAGMNADNYPLEKLRTIASVFDRHINDDEMKYLYSNCDYVLLPYRKSSQSGIFEMASYFRKPMLLTDIDYFKSQLEMHHDWGVIASIENYGDLIKKTLENNSIFYVNDDKQTDKAYCCFVEELKMTL